MESCGIHPQHLSEVRMVVHLLGWNCSPCRVNFRTLFSPPVEDAPIKLAFLESELADFKNQLAEIKVNLALIGDRQNTNSQTNPEEEGAQLSSLGYGSTKALYSDVVDIGSKRSKGPPMAPVSLNSFVERTVSDIQKRKFNLVVSGIPESSSEGDDRAKFMDLCHLIELVPTVTKNSRYKPPKGQARDELTSENISRGKPRPHLLFVTLASEVEVSLVLSRARDLRKKTDTFTQQNVFINPHLSREEGQILYAKRAARRLANTTGPGPFGVQTLVGTPSGLA